MMSLLSNGSPLQDFNYNDFDASAVDASTSSGTIPQDPSPASLAGIELPGLVSHEGAANDLEMLPEADLPPANPEWSISTRSQDVAMSPLPHLLSCDRPGCLTTHQGVETFEVSMAYIT